MSHHWSERQWRMITDERMAPLELVEQQAEGDLVREMLDFAADRITKAEVETRTGAAKGERQSQCQVPGKHARKRTTKQNNSGGYGDADGIKATDIDKLRLEGQRAPHAGRLNRARDCDIIDTVLW